VPESGRLYLDYNATNPLRPQARAAVEDALATPGNASSVHAEGRAARARIEAARAAVAGLVGGSAKLVTFTSGATEANNTVLTPERTLAGKPYRADVLLVGATEHPSVLAGGRFLPDRVRTIPVDGEGIVDLDALRRLLADAGGRALVSVMLANNETGAIQPVAEVAAIGHAAGAIVHTDAVQAAGRIPVNITALGVDALTVSAHKIGGPQGVGAIVRAHEDLRFAPLLVGGGQEQRMRPGTENTPGIAGFGAAATAALADLGRTADWAEWRDGIADIVTANGHAIVFSAGAERVPQTLCFGVPGVRAETLVIALDLAGVAVSSGAACTSGKVAPSYVLAAMGVPPDLARSAIRVSLGWHSARQDLDSFATAWRSVVSRMSLGEYRAA
jgi:cysteine desulfurase